MVEQRVRSRRPSRTAFASSRRRGSDYTAPVVIADLDGKDLIGLVGEQRLPADWVGRVRALEPSGNAHQVKLGLSTPLLSEGCLIGGFSPSGLTTKDLTVDLMHHTVATIEKGVVSDPLAIYAPVPSNFDPRLSPDGTQLVVASVFGSSRPRGRTQETRWRSTVLDALDRAVPGFKKALLFADFEPIPRIGAWMGKSSRAAICNGQVPGQVGKDRLSVRTPIPGLFLAGDGAGGTGIGTELAVRSARQAVSSALAVLP